MRLLVARCEVRYTGRLTAVLPEAVRLLILNQLPVVQFLDDYRVELIERSRD
jgi:RecB family endonuclease NucS